MCGRRGGAVWVWGCDGHGLGVGWAGVRLWGGRVVRVGVWGGCEVGEVGRGPCGWVS